MRASEECWFGCGCVYVCVCELFSSHPLVTNQQPKDLFLGSSSDTVTSSNSKHISSSNRSFCVSRLTRRTSIKTCGTAGARASPIFVSQSAWERCPLTLTSAYQKHHPAPAAATTPAEPTTPTVQGIPVTASAPACTRTWAMPRTPDSQATTGRKLITNPMISRQPISIVPVANQSNVRFC